MIKCNAERPILLVDLQTGEQLGVINAVPPDEHVSQFFAKVFPDYLGHLALRESCPALFRVFFFLVSRLRFGRSFLGISRKEIIGAVGLTGRTVDRALAALAKDGHIKPGVEGNARGFFVNPAFVYLGPSRGHYAALAAWRLRFGGKAEEEAVEYLSLERGKA